jgi:two-component system chemotaxis response regulator CheB
MADQEDHPFIVAIGASAGGLQAIIDLLSSLPARLNAPIVIAVHSEPASKLSEVLQARSQLEICKAEDGDVLQPGTVYILPGATHGFFKDKKLHLSSTVRNSGFRPSIDALFMTMASEYRERAIAVVLSGTMSDGMRGAQIIYDMGGETIVQDPDDAQFPDMPENVIKRDHPTIIAKASALGDWLSSKIGTM